MEPDVVDRMVARWEAERPDLNVSSMSILARVSLAHRLFARLLDREYARAGLNTASFDVLAMLRQIGVPYRLTPTQLYTSLRVSSGTMTNRIDQLERAGMVVRVPDPHDRRGLLVELTPKGLEAVDALVARHAELGAQLVSSLPATERECLVSGLRDLIHALEEVEPGSGKPASEPTELIKPYMRWATTHSNEES